MSFNVSLFWLQVNKTQHGKDYIITQEILFVQKQKWCLKMQRMCKAEHLHLFKPTLEKLRICE
jgi:hypothetical protein